MAEFSFLRGRLRTEEAGAYKDELELCFHSFEVGFGLQLIRNNQKCQSRRFHSFEVGFGPAPRTLKTQTRDRRFHSFEVGFGLGGPVCGARRRSQFSFLRGRLRTKKVKIRYNRSNWVFSFLRGRLRTRNCGTGGSVRRPVFIPSR